MTQHDLNVLNRRIGERPNTKPTEPVPGWFKLYVTFMAVAAIGFMLANAWAGAR